MKKFYSFASKKFSAMQEKSTSLSSLRSKGVGIFAGALLLTGISSPAVAQVTVGLGSTTNSNAPVNTNWGFTYSQQIYKKAEINAAGAITAISFRTNTAAPTNWANSKDWVVYMGHSSKSTFESSTDWVPVSGLTQVFAGEVSYPASTPGFVVITLATPFVYNNIDNLVIAVDENTPNYGGSVEWSSSTYTPAIGNNRTISYRNDSNNPSPTAPPSGTLSNTRANVVLAGITMSCPQPTNVMASNVTTSSAVLSWTASAGTSSLGYEYEIRTSGAAGSGATGLVMSGTTASGVVTAAISSLIGQTNYTAYVRSVCAGTDTSSYSEGVNFRTGHCIPSSTGNDTYLNAVSTTGGTPTNISNLNSGFTPTGYQDNYATQSVTTTATSTFQLSYNIVGGTAAIAVWVDFNNDLVFDPSEKIHAPVGYQENGDHTVALTMPGNVTPGEYRLRIKVDWISTNPLPCTTGDTRSETEDYKVVIVPQAIDAPDAATVGTFTAGLIPVIVTSIQSCQSVEVSATVTEPGLTDTAGAAATITGWIGRSDTNTDPATWPDSAWVLATYSADQATSDLYKATITNLTVGTKYFASRFRIGTGVFVFGGQNGLWNATTSMSAPLEVIAPPAITATTTSSSICNLSSATLTATSSNANYVYSWSPGTATTASIVVTPSETTIYTVTGTDSLTGCTSTATVTVVVNPTPSPLTINEDDMVICGDSIAQLSTSGSTTVTEGQIGNESFITTAYEYPNPLSTHYGGVKNQMIYTVAELQALGMVEGTVITSIGFDIASATGTKVCNDFTIRLGKTTQATLTTFVPLATLATVYNQTYLVTAPGPVTFNLTESFVWDGITNLVVETTHNAGNAGGGATTYIKYSNTVGDLSFYGANDYVIPATVAAFDLLTSWQSTGASTKRPNALFGFESVATVSWTPIAGLFADENATIPYTAAQNLLTVYAVPTATTTYTATSSTAFCSVSDSVVVTVADVPATPTGVSPQAASTLADLIVSPITVTWYSSQADAASGTNALPATTIVVDGATYFAVNATGNCRSEALAIVIDASLATQSFDFSSLKYYPNPVTDVLNISFSENISGYSVFNMVGQQVLVGKVNATTASVDMSTLPAGSYLVQIQTANGSKMIKLIKN